MKKSELLLPLITAFGMTACSTQPSVVFLPNDGEYRPLASQYPAPQSYSRIAWNSGGVFGPCVASETSSPPMSASAKQSVANAMDMNAVAASQFGAMRTGANIFCGYNNPLAAGKNAVATAAAGAPTFSSYMTLPTGEYLMADKNLQCRGEIVAVDVRSAGPGKLPRMTRNAPGGIFIPSGYAIPLGVVRDDYGNAMASSQSCETIKTYNTPTLRNMPN